ncbi:hypothetical protein CCACVL1_22931 [Corchorus capsularis]|uniref:Retrotransposon gag protein n=1 Tax=Corchorus capsularis TaxID=210143 RepID=A0A1R3GVV1_COCAP|nr:hypothetical protein CCACVL1_22931 [Corchorus capsularis]
MEQSRTLRELNFNCEVPSLYIDYPASDTSYKLNSEVINMLPIFQGESHENPHKLLQSFFIKCAAFTGIPEEQVRLRTFAFTLEGKAKAWFLNRTYFDSASGGSFTLKTPKEARKLLNTIAENIYQFNATSETLSSKPLEPENKRLNNLEATVNSIAAQQGDLLKMVTNLITMFSQNLMQPPSCISQVYTRESLNGLNNSQSQGVNSIEGTQHWSTQKMEWPDVLSPPVISPFLTPVSPDKPLSTAVSDEPVQGDDEISAKSKEDQPTSSPQSSRPQSRSGWLKEMEPIQRPPPFPKRFAPQRKRCNDESQSDSLQKEKVNIPLIAAIQEVPKEQWKPIDLVKTTQRHQDPIVKEVEGAPSETINDLELYELDLQDSFQFFFKEDDDEPCKVRVPTLPKEVSKIVQEAPKAPQGIKMDIPPPSPLKLAKLKDKPPDDEQPEHPELNETSVRDFVDNQLLEHEDQDFL